MDFTQWGKIILSIEKLTIIKKHDSKLFYYITKNNKHHSIQIKLKNKIILEFTDKINV